MILAAIGCVPKFHEVLSRGLMVRLCWDGSSWMSVSWGTFGTIFPGCCSHTAIALSLLKIHNVYDC